MKPYCNSIFERKRMQSQEVLVGQLALGANNPIRIQSMTTTDTMDTQKSVEQSIRMINVGCELVRLTAPSKKEAENLKNIRETLHQKGFYTPLVADIHFTPNAAEIAAEIVEKVRVNPGNYADKKKFEAQSFTDESYEKELQRIEEKFTPLVLKCKAHSKAMRIGTNHGSLSDRIMARYGDTPKGMVESALEFVRICEKNQFYNLVISMKASNTLVMVQAYRLLMSEMIASKRIYPLHLGVTEAGDGEDGRIKSAVGIGALLEDGIGDTIRVSLTEAPEMEIPVAQKIIRKYSKTNMFIIPDKSSKEYFFDPFNYSKRESQAQLNIGNNNVPVVVSDFSSKKSISEANLFGIGYHYSKTLDKWEQQDQAADYIFIGNAEFSLDKPASLGVICSEDNWRRNHLNKKRFFPITNDLTRLKELSDEADIVFLSLPAEKSLPEELKNYSNLVLVLETVFDNRVQIFRKAMYDLYQSQCQFPVIFKISSKEKDFETFQLDVSSETGTMFLDGFGDGLWLHAEQPQQKINATAFGILQATRTRISKTEYISCPSCGRTLFDLQETTAKIREKTEHLKGVKIGIMGCIVNGPGEMADADYGYVGSGPGKINLYKEKSLIKRNIPEESAVDELIELIRTNGDWIEK